MRPQASSEVFFRKVNFWDKGGRDAPPVFNVDGVSYLYVKVALFLMFTPVLFSGSICVPPLHSFWMSRSLIPPLAMMQDGGVFLVATTRENVSPSLVLELLKRIGGIIKVGP